MPRARGADRSYEMKSLEQVRVLAHPLRLRLLETFAEGPMTTKQAAERMGVQPTRLYHHTRALERVGLIRLRETRPNRGTVEKHFEAIAGRLTVDPRVFARPGRTMAPAGLAKVVHRVFDAAKAELLAGVSRDPPWPKELEPMAVRLVVVGSSARLAEVRRELVAWLERMQGEAGPAESRPAGEAARAGITLVFAPAGAPARPSRRPRATGESHPRRGGSSRGGSPRGVRPMKSARRESSDAPDA